MDISYPAQKKIKYLEDKGMEISDIRLIDPKTGKVAIIDPHGKVYWEVPINESG